MKDVKKLTEKDIKDEVIFLAMASAHLEAIDNLFVNGKTIFTKRAKQWSKRLQKNLIHIINEVEKNLDEHHIEQLDALSDLYEQAMNEAHKLYLEAYNEAISGENH